MLFYQMSSPVIRTRKASKPPASRRGTTSMRTEVPLAGMAFLMTHKIFFKRKCNVFVRTGRCEALEGLGMIFLMTAKKESQSSVTVLDI
jgi:hypothetical protein